MRNILVLLLLMGYTIFKPATIFSIGSSRPGEPKNKYALIIAVGDYPEETGWTKISSLNDVDLIKTSLLKQGFPEKNITIITNAGATKTGIVSALQNLESRVKPGDIVAIHYSGHGQQIQDDNGDELDGFDESIIPFDAHKSFRKGVYEGEKHFRDDELNLYLNNIRERLGNKGNLLVILDACHSGTGTRGNGKARGTQEVFTAPGYTPKPGTGINTGFDEERTTNTEGKLAPMVLISGAGQKQLNFEYTDDAGNSYGSLSYAFSSIIPKVTVQTTYRSLFDQIKNLMSVIAPNQSPQIEGDIDYQIFGGSYIQQVPYYIMDKYINDQTIRIKGGKLMTLNEGTKIGCYPMNTADPEDKAPIVEGEIVSSTMLESVIKLTRPMQEEQLQNCWLFVKEINYGSMVSKIRIGSLNDYPDLRTEFESKLNKLPTVRIDNSNPDLILECNKTRGDAIVQLVTPDDMVLFSESLNKYRVLNTLVDELMEIIKSFNRAELIRNLDLSDSSLNVVFRLIPVEVIQDELGNYKVEKTFDINTKTSNGQITFKPGDVFQIEVTNKGKKEAFFQIIDISPLNEVSVLVPAAGYPADEFRIAPWSGPMVLAPFFAFSEPYGNEMFKLIATREEINLNGIVTSKGKGTRSNLGPLDILLQDSYTQTRAGTLSIPPKSASIYTMVIKIVP
jgi:metacaspase-1